MSDVLTSPVDTTEEQHYDKMSHIVLEGWKPDDGSDFVPTNNCVVEGFINGTPVRSLCGKVWVPRSDPRRYPLCGTCREIAEYLGWEVPQS